MKKEIFEKKKQKVRFNFIGYFGIILLLHSIYILIVKVSDELPNIYSSKVDYKIIFFSFLISLVILKKSNFLDNDKKDL
jgi:hypothetical protein